MTCIVGYCDAGKVYIGGDSAGCSNYDIRMMQNKKVFIKGDMIFGYTSSFRMGQLLQYSLNVPEHKSGKSDIDYLCSDFAKALTDCFKDNGFARISNNETQGGIFLLGYRGKLYRVENDYHISLRMDKFDACGCGEFYALGALKAIETVKMTAYQRIGKALQAAEYFSAAVRGPFVIEHIGRVPR